MKDGNARMMNAYGRIEFGIRLVRTSTATIFAHCPNRDLIAFDTEKNQLYLSHTRKRMLNKKPWNDRIFSVGRLQVIDDLLQCRCHNWHDLQEWTVDIGSFGRSFGRCVNWCPYWRRWLRNFNVNNWFFRFGWFDVGVFGHGAAFDVEKFGEINAFLLATWPSLVHIVKERHAGMMTTRVCGVLIVWEIFIISLFLDTST